MATWNLTLHCSRLFVYKKLLAQVAERVSSASYHATSSTLQYRRDGDAKPGVKKRRSILPSAGVPRRPAVLKTWQGHDGADDIPGIPASKKIWRTDTPGSRESRPWAEGRVSSELQKLSLDDFPEARERVEKDSKEDRNCETLFGVSPCLLALTQGRRRARTLYVKEGDTFKRASVQQVCEEAHRKGVQIQRVGKKELDKMCSGRVHQGVCLQASPLTLLSEDEAPQPPRAGSAPPLWLVLDAIQDPMNLGAIIRSSYYLGVDRIVSSLHNSCPLSPVVSKASSGVMEIMQVFGYESLADMLKVKVSQGWQVVGTVGAEGRGLPAPVLSCSEFHMTRPTLLLMGGEGTGLSQELCLQCDILLTVPPLRALVPGVDSLNVSVATGILLHSLLSSRREGGQR